MLPGTNWHWNDPLAMMAAAANLYPCYLWAVACAMWTVNHSLLVAALNEAALHAQARTSDARRAPDRNGA